MRTMLEFKRFCHDAGLSGHFIVHRGGFTVTLRPHGTVFGDRYEGEAKSLHDAAHAAIDQYLRCRSKEMVS